MESAFEPHPPVLSTLVYKHRTVGRVVAVGDADGTVKFHYRNGTLIKVGGIV